MSEEYYNEWMEYTSEDDESSMSWAEVENLLWN